MPKNYKRGSHQMTKTFFQRQMPKEAAAVKRAARPVKRAIKFAGSRLKNTITK